MPQIAQQDYNKINVGEYGLEETVSYQDEIKQDLENAFFRGTLFDTIIVNNRGSAARILSYLSYEGLLAQVSLAVEREIVTINYDE